MELLYIYYDRVRWKRLPKVFQVPVCYRFLALANEVWMCNFAILVYSGSLLFGPNLWYAVIPNPPSGFFLETCAEMVLFRFFPVPLSLPNARISASPKTSNSPWNWKMRPSITGPYGRENGHIGRVSLWFDSVCSRIATVSAPQSIQCFSHLVFGSSLFSIDCAEFASYGFRIWLQTSKVRIPNAPHKCLNLVYANPAICMREDTSPAMRPPGEMQLSK